MMLELMFSFASALSQ